MQAFDILANLPCENSLYIMSYLTKSEIVKCCEVSKIWNAIACDNSLWKGILPIVNTSSKTGIKKYIESHFIREKKDVINHIKTFVNQMRLNQTGTFLCCFPSHPEYTISVKITCGALPSDELKETWLFKKLPNEGAPCEIHKRHVPFGDFSFDSSIILPGQENENSTLSDQITALFNHRIKELTQAAS